jgi:hypothetical protein
MLIDPFYEIFYDDKCIFYDCSYYAARAYIISSMICTVSGESG